MTRAVCGGSRAACSVFRATIPIKRNRLAIISPATSPGDMFFTKAGTATSGWDPTSMCLANFAADCRKIMSRKPTFRETVRVRLPKTPRAGFGSAPKTASSFNWLAANSPRSRRRMACRTRPCVRFMPMRTEPSGLARLAADWFCAAMKNSRSSRPPTACRMTTSPRWSRMTRGVYGAARAVEFFTWPSPTCWRLRTGKFRK